MISVISIILLILSSSLTLAVIILKNSELIAFKEPRLLHMVKNALVHFLLLLSLFIYRSLCELPKILFYAYVYANAGIIICFYFVRFHMIITAYDNPKLGNYIAFFSVFLVSTLFGLSRMFFRIGFIIDQNPHIILVIENIGIASVGFFGHLGKRVSGQMPTSPGSSGIDKHFALGLGTFFATSVAATGGVYLCYEAYQTRQINLRILKLAEDTAKAAEVSATATQQRTDIKAVKHGLLSLEEYNNKKNKKKL